MDSKKAFCFMAVKDSSKVFFGLDLLLFKRKLLNIYELNIAVIPVID